MSDKWYISGPLAIGTPEPKGTLHVEGSGIHSSGPGAGLSFQNRQSSSFVETPTAGERWVWYAREGAAHLWSGNDKLSISREGNVGIGTASPENSENFHTVVDVMSKERAKLSLRTTTGGIDARMMAHSGQYWSGLAGMVLGTKSDHPVSIGAKGQVRITLSTNGNVGIGTTNPGAKLDVVGHIRGGSLDADKIYSRNLWVQESIGEGLDGRTVGLATGGNIMHFKWSGDRFEIYVNNIKVRSL